MPAMAATMVPFAFVFSMEEGIWKSVVLPVFDIENKVEVAEAVEEAIAKRIVFGEVSPVFACIESRANGDDVPIPTRTLF